MPKPTIQVDKSLLQSSINVVEKNGAISNRSELWPKVADEYNSKSDVKITFSVAYSRFREWEMVCKTPVGKRGRSILTDDQKQKMADGRQKAGPRKSRGEKMANTAQYDKHVERLKEMTPPRFQKLLEKVLGGSRTAAVKLNCIACMGFQVNQIHACSGYSCPMFLYRPYQKPTDIETDSDVNEGLVGTEEPEDIEEETEEIEETEEV